LVSCIFTFWNFVKVYISCYYQVGKKLNSFLHIFFILLYNTQITISIQLNNLPCSQWLFANVQVVNRIHRKRISDFSDRYIVTLPNRHHLNFWIFICKWNAPLTEINENHLELSPVNMVDLVILPTAILWFFPGSS